MKEQKVILVTGGTGFVGSYLLRYLLHSGYSNIKATCRPGSRMDLVEDIKDQIAWIEIDMLDVLGLEDAMQGVEQVYHCAALVSILPADAQKMLFVNREGTANVVNAALETGVKKLIHVSSIAAIGHPKNITVNTEKNAWERSYKVSNYSISKYLAEQEVWRAWAEGLSVGIVNPSVVLGSGRWEEGPLRLFGACWNQIPFYPSGIMGFVDVRDVVRFMVELMESPINGERFILSSESEPYRQVQTQIAQALGKRPPKWKATPMLLRVGAFFEELRARLMGTAPLVTSDVAFYAANKNAFSNEKSVQGLNFSYRPLNDTIQDTANAFIEADQGTRTGKPLAF